MLNKDGAQLLIKLLDKAEFRITASEALLLTKTLHWLKGLTEEVKQIDKSKMELKDAKSN